MQSLVAVDSLTKRFGNVEAVRDVSFAVRPGEMIGLVGANGGGKTTTLRMIAGLLRPDGGEGQVLGRDIYGQRRVSLANIGYMSQRLSLYAELSVRENLAFRARAHRLARPAISIAEIVERYGLHDMLDRRVGLLSGGWARRVQFAATVLHAPPLLLLDEPTAGLDIATRRAIWRWLGELRGCGCGVVVSTHDLADAEQCDRIVPYHEGSAHAALTPSDFAAAQGAGSLEEAILTLAAVA